MFTQKGGNKLKWTVLIVCCLSSSFEQWTRVMFPFALWSLKPRPEFSEALMINALGGVATLIGTFFVANMIDTIGSRKTALISVLFVCIFQAGYSWITNYYLFILFQLLMLFNHMPTVVDATITQLANEIADVKQKARLMAQTAIPTSIAFALGPLIAVQLISGTWNTYDSTIRLHLTGTMLTQPAQMAKLALLLGAASIIANFVFLPLLQKSITTKRIVQLSLVIMTISYFYLTKVTQFDEIIIGMPFQVVGVCLALGPLSAQILGSVPASHAGKSAALNRIAQISATALAPLITGAYTDHDEAYLLCYINIGICIVTFILIEIYGNFMGKSFGSLCNAVGSLAIGQMTDSIGPKIMFLFSTILTSIYFVGLGLCRTWITFFLLQILRVGYQLDSTAEMYLATVTTERERTGALMILSIPQAISMFFAPIVGSRIASYTTLRASQMICGGVMPIVLIPVDYWPMVTKNQALREGLILRALLIVAYVCYELIARNFVLRSYMHLTSENAEVMVTMGGSLVITQFLILPFLQRHVSPRTLLQLACIALFFAYGGIIFTSSFYEYLLVTAIHTGAYAIAYAESSTQITGAVEIGDLGKATGLASMVQWTSHFLIPLYTSHIVNSWHYTYAFYSSSLLALITLGRRSNIGSINAAVLPVPVAEHAQISRPASATGIHAA
uniref:Major facilitator superfamily (MFS) profile domain-containing protein n=1 Tax=Meloidogyne javanica TaxID=6303 RepID=A0A915M8K8_MELJA